MTDLFAELRAALDELKAAEVAWWNTNTAHCADLTAAYYRLAIARFRYDRLARYEVPKLLAAYDALNDENANNV